MAKVKLSGRQVRYLREHTGIHDLNEASRMVMQIMVEEDIDPGLLMECLDLLIEIEDSDK